jgi:hypothetical protein
MNATRLALTVLNDTFAICRLEPNAAIPVWAVNSTLSSITRTPDELSVVCRQGDVPEGITCEKGWRCLRVQGPLDFALTGILASLATTLAEGGISIFAISTFDTDYILVKQHDLPRAIQALSGAGHVVKS